MTDDASPENLRKFLESDDPALVRMGIAMAKGAGVEVTVKDLEHFLKSEDVETVKTGFTFAEEAGVGDEAMELLCERLADDDYEGRIATAEALGKIGDARAVEPLILIMENAAVDERFSVLQDAADALGVIGDERAVTPLIGVLDSVPSRFVRMSAMTALGAIGDDRAVDSLIAVLGAEFDQFGRPWGYDAYSRTETDDSGVHSCAAEALENLTGGPIVKCLIDALENDDYDVRRYAAGALGKIDDVRAVEPLIKALADEDEEVCDAAKEALKKLGHEVE